MPNVAIELGNKFGRLMNYSDGIYGGQFVGGMYCEAFFESDIFKIIDAGLRCIPAESQYAEMVRDVVAWYRENPDDWEATWTRCQKKYRENPEYQQCSNGGIDVKINGAYILIGMLYGKGDFDKTIILSTRCGQDSDCNPSNAAGVLFATVGFEKLPPRFTEKIDLNTKFHHTAYNIPALLDVCEKLARELLVREGGRIEKDAEGNEIFVIPVKPARPNALELSWEPGPIADSKFTEEELTQIKMRDSKVLSEAIALRFPGWSLRDCGPDMEPGLRDNYRGRRNVFLTHPLDRQTPCVLFTVRDIPAGRKTTLHAIVGHHQGGDWELVIRINGSPQQTLTIGSEGGDRNGWREISFDLTPFAGGNNVTIELENKANGWYCEAGSWAELDIIP